MVLNVIIGGVVSAAKVLLSRYSLRSTPRLFHIALMSDPSVTMHKKETLLALSQRSQQGTSTLLGGMTPAEVVLKDHYIPLMTAAPKVPTRPASAAEKTSEPTSAEQAVLAALSDATRTPAVVTVVGPAGSGKTTALEKVLAGWAKGQHLHGFSYAFHFHFDELNLLHHAGETLSVETLISRRHAHLSAESIAQLLQEPEKILFVFDELDVFKHSLDPSGLSLCSDRGQSTTVSVLVGSLLHGALLKGAAVLLASRPTEGLGFLPVTKAVHLLGFLKPQRKAYASAFFAEPRAAGAALSHMERTLGFYDFCTSPRFCWTVFSVYKSLTEAGEGLPETLTQLFVKLLVHLLRPISAKETGLSHRELVSALGRLARHCGGHQGPGGCTKAQADAFGFGRFLASSSSSSVGALLRVGGAGEPGSDGCVFSFHSRVVREFLLAASFYLDKSASDATMELLDRPLDGRAKVLELFLSGLSEAAQRGPLEAALGDFSSDQVAAFKAWLKSGAQQTLQGCDKAKHLRYYGLLHQSQSAQLVRDVVTPSARIGISYGGGGLQDYVGLNYVLTSLGDTLEQLNLYNTKDLTEEQAEVLKPAMRMANKIMLSQSILRPGAVPHLASALGEGRAKELDLSYCHLGDAGFRELCTGLTHSQLHTLKLTVCKLTEACCGDLVSALTSGAAQLRVLDLNFNELQDQGATQLCHALSSPSCKVQTLTLHTCQLTEASMEALSAALSSGGCEVRTLDLTGNAIGDAGVKLLAKALQSPLCKLQSLNLFGSSVTAECCADLAQALSSEHCPLLELDLSVNELGQEGALELCEALSKPGCPLEKISLTRCEMTESVFQKLGSLLRSGTSRLTSLCVSLNSVGDQGARHLWEAVANPFCLLENLEVEMIELTDGCVEDLCAAVRASSRLKSIDMRNNVLTDASVPALVQVMQDSDNMLELNLRYNDFSEDAFELLDECDKIRY